jgi:hypothetical protein
MVLPATAAALATGGAVGAAIGILNELQIRKEDVERIAKMLTSFSETVQEGVPAPIGLLSFGESSAGTQLGHHTSIANRHVREAMLEMVAGLNVYRDNVQAVAQDFFSVDDDIEATMNSITTATSCVAPTTFTDPENCALPGTGDS